MITENLSTLKIHKLTQAQYDRELEAGRIDPNALYLTPNEEIDLSQYATIEQLNGKADIDHTHSTDTSRASKEELDEHKADTNVHMTNSEKSKLSSIEEGANNYSHPTHSPATSGLYKLTVNEFGHVTSVTPATKADITELGIPEQDTTYNAAGTDLGLVKSGGDVTISNGVITVNDDSHNHTIDNIDNLQGTLDGNLSEAKGYTDSKVSALSSTIDTKITTHNTSTDSHGDIRVLLSGLATEVSNFLDVDDTTRDQLSEVLELIDNNKGTLDSLTISKVNVSDIIDNLTTASANKVLSANQGVILKNLIDTLEGVVDSKADEGHVHAISDITNLQNTLNEKATQTNLDEHTSNTTKHITSTERTNWGTAYTHSQSAHAPSNAQANQNAFSNIAVSGQTTVAADTTTDTVTFVGSNVSITTDATNDKVTFSVADGTTSAKGIVQLTNSTSSTSTTTAATPSSVKSAYDLANTAKTNAATAQSKADSAYTLASNVQSELENKSNTNHTHDDRYYTEEESKKEFVSWNRGSLDVDDIYNAGVYMVSSGSNVPSGSNYGVVFGLPYRNLTENKTPDFGGQIFIPNGDDDTKPNSMFYRTSLKETWNEWQEVATTSDLDKKQNTITGGASTITSSNLTSSRALVSNSSGKVAISDVTSTELGYLSGAKSNVQAQLDAKVPNSRTINGKALSSNITLSASDVGAASSSHSHDDKYYTESEINTKLASKSDSNHNHDDKYCTKAELESYVNEKFLGGAW